MYEAADWPGLTAKATDIGRRVLSALRPTFYFLLPGGEVGRRGVGHVLSKKNVIQAHTRVVVLHAAPGLSLLMSCLALGLGCGAPSIPRAVNREPWPELLHLRGRVVAADTGEGVSSARVVASGHQSGGRGHWERAGVTDETGAFRFSVPRDDAVEVHAEHPEFGLQWTTERWYSHRYHGPVPDGPIRIELHRGIVLRGRLLDPEGRPVPHHRVMVFLPPPMQVCMTSVCRHVRATTDANGEFRFDRMLLSPEMHLAWSHPDAPLWMSGTLVQPGMAAYIVAADAGQPIEIVIAALGWDEEFREILEQAADEEAGNAGER